MFAVVIKNIQRYSNKVTNKVADKLLAVHSSIECSREQKQKRNHIIVIM